MAQSVNISVLASHTGTNLQSLIDASESGQLQGTIRLVISNNKDAGALSRAQRHGIPTLHLSSRTHENPRDLDQEMARALEEHGTDVVFLLGYLKKIGPITLSRFQGRIINLHPALLPKFGGQGMYGLAVHQAVINAKEPVTGVSVHIVTDEYDEGPVIAQREAAVEVDDTAQTLAHRIQELEHYIVVDVVNAIARGDITLHRSH